MKWKKWKYEKWKEVEAKMKTKYNCNSKTNIKRENERKNKIEHKS